jgi:hypothetical protein
MVLDHILDQREALHESIQRAQLHFRSSTITGWILAIDGEISRVREHDEIGYGQLPPYKRQLRETHRCTVCGAVVRILENSEAVITLGATEWEEGNLQDALRKHYTNKYNLPQQRYTHWEGDVHLDALCHTCENQEASITLADTGAPNVLIIDLGEQIVPQSKPRIPQCIQLPPLNNPQKNHAYYHTATLDTHTTHLHSFVPGSRGWFTITKDKIMRIEPDLLTSTLNFASPNVVVYTRAATKAFQLGDMISIRKKATAKTTTGKRSYQTMLSLGLNTSCREERLTPNLFPAQMNPVQSLIPQMLALNRTLSGYFTTEYATFGRQPDRDMGTIQEGESAQWRTKQNSYRMLKLGRGPEPPWSKTQREYKRRERKLRDIKTHLARNSGGSGDTTPASIISES